MRLETVSTFGTKSSLRTRLGILDDTKSAFELHGGWRQQYCSKSIAEEDRVPADVD